MSVLEMYLPNCNDRVSKNKHHGEGKDCITIIQYRSLLFMVSKSVLFIAIVIVNTDANLILEKNKK